VEFLEEKVEFLEGKLKFSEGLWQFACMVFSYYNASVTANLSQIPCNIFHKRTFPYSTVTEKIQQKQQKQQKNVARERDQYFHENYL